MDNNKNNSNSWEDGKLMRHLNSLIVAHLRHNNLIQAATAVASATMIPLNVDVPPNKLIQLVAKGLAVEKDDVLRGTSSSLFGDLNASLPVAPQPSTTAVDFSAVLDTKGVSKSFPKHETRHLSEHKNIARCAKFSPDGKFVATGSADTSIKLFEVSKINQMLLPDTKDGPVRPVVRTFYDHIQPINDLDFHPQGTILVSGAKDQTIKFFDISKAIAKRANRVIQDTHNVRSVSFHPSGDFLLAGTDHAIPHLYDINTFQCYLSANTPEVGPNGAINQVRYSSTGAVYVTASKNGAIQLWDGITANCVRSITGAHGTAEATSAIFTKDQRFVLSCGKDSTIKLWDVGSGRLVKQYVGAIHTQLRCQAIFNETEEFVLSIDEMTNEIVIWDAMTTEKVAKWPSNHAGAPRWLEHSPVESAFISCGTDRSIRFWKESL
ncbi:PREDICTED: cleavage stimulation factor subunit 50 [Lupinus angustifolius]|uniref:cleavage stimulation factor subunit 50 n=1 Tax=Lupinus angustifolius TaxID=3871 RepID=UPI00092E558F|nr:PREDICTED: cleavage stimulation factor subunit 50 [Lupinus angustifolius]